VEACGDADCSDTPSKKAARRALPLRCGTVRCDAACSVLNNPNRYQPQPSYNSMLLVNSPPLGLSCKVAMRCANAAFGSCKNVAIARGCHEHPTDGSGAGDGSPAWAGISHRQKWSWPCIIHGCRCLRNLCFQPHQSAHAATPSWSATPLQHPFSAMAFTYSCYSYLCSKVLQTL